MTLKELATMLITSLWPTAFSYSSNVSASAKPPAQDASRCPEGVPVVADQEMRRGNFVVGSIRKHPTQKIWAYEYVNRDGLIWRTDFVKMERAKPVYYQSTGLTDDRGLINRMMGNQHTGCSTSDLNEAFMNSGAWPLAKLV